MAVVSVEIPDSKAKQFSPFSVIAFDDFQEEMNDEM